MVASRHRHLLAALLCALALCLTTAETAQASTSFCRSGSPTVLFASGGRHVLAYTPLETRVWDLEGREIFRLSGEVWRAISPDGRTIATQRADNTVRLWGLDGRQRAVLSGHAAPVSHVLFSPDGRQIATASPGDVVRLWTSDGAPVAALNPEVGTDGPHTVAFSPDSARLLTAGPGPARLWDRAGQPVGGAGAELGQVSGAAFSPDGSQIIVAGERGAMLADLGGRPVASLARPEAAVTRVSFSSDGRHLLTMLADNSSWVWDTNGQPVGSALGPAQFSPDGQALLTIGQDGTAWLRDLSGRSLASFWVRGSEVTDATFSPDSRRIVTVTENGPLQLWDQDGQQLAQFRGSSSWGCITARAAFSPDGARAATVGVYRTVQLWDLQKMRSIDLQMGGTTWYWLQVINPTLLIGTLGLWLVAVRLRAPTKPRLQTQRTLLGIWPAWAAAHGLIFLLALTPIWLVQVAAGWALGHMLWHIVRGYLPQVSGRVWLAASVLGWIAGWAAGEGVRLVLFTHGVYIDTRLVILPLAGAGMALGQWVATRRGLPGAHWVALAALAGWALGPLVAGAEFTSGRLELAMIQGITAGALPGAVLVWMLLAPEGE
ncbi:MAG: hypothetical protein RLZZ387_829 [Chloroflexota bacterium]|jgi:WD40 repeat protein/uncharacterized membrane protein (Fun14 family)